MKNKITDYLPAGYRTETVYFSLIFGYFISVMVSLIYYLSTLFSQIGNLYYYEAGEKVLKTGAVMPEFIRTRGDAFDVFEIFVYCMLAFTVYNFIYHHIGSKSIYTMKRLKSKTEFYKRCLAVPVAAIVIAGILVVVLNYLYLLIYKLAVPDGVLLYPDWNKMWRF